jgi:hypothetical protein
MKERSISMLRAPFERAARRSSPRQKRASHIAWFAFAAVVGSHALLTMNSAEAQVSDDYLATQRDFRSSENFGFELRLGPYVPDVGEDTFKKTFPSDHGLLLGFEFEYIALQLRDILYLNPAFSFGYANYSGKALDTEEVRTDEEVEFTMIPLSLLGVVRVDVLARKLGIPLLFAGKLGYRWSIWNSSKGGSKENSGISPSWTWAVQFDLDLDTFDPRGARLLDEEWGINHTFLFFEVFGSKSTKDGLKLDDTTWTVGIGFIS